jgi:hypothetical protein
MPGREAALGALRAGVNLSAMPRIDAGMGGAGAM